MQIKLTTRALCSPGSSSQELTLVLICHDGLEWGNVFLHEEYSCYFKGYPSSENIVISEHLVVF